MGVHFQADRAHNSSQFLEGTFPPEVPFLCTPVCIKRGGRPFAVLKYKRVLQPLSMEEILNFDKLSGPCLGQDCAHHIAHKHIFPARLSESGRVWIDGVFCLAFQLSI